MGMQPYSLQSAVRPSLKLFVWDSAMNHSFVTSATTSGAMTRSEEAMWRRSQPPRAIEDSNYKKKTLFFGKEKWEK